MAINKRFQNILDEIRLEEKKLEEYESDIKITFLGDIVALIKGDETYKLNRSRLLDQREKVNSISNEFDRRTYYGLNGVLSFLERSISTVEGELYYFTKLRDFPEDMRKHQGTGYKDLMFDISRSNYSFVILPNDCILDLNEKIRDGEFNSISEVDEYLSNKGIKHITFPAYEDILFFNYENEYKEGSIDQVPSNIVKDFPYLENLITDFLAYSFENHDEHKPDKMNDYLAELYFKCRDEDTKKMIKTL